MKSYRVEQVNGATGRARTSQTVPEILVSAEREEIRTRARSNPKFSSDWVRVTEA